MESASRFVLQAQAPGVDFAFFAMMGAIFMVFYVLVVRPQQRAQREREAHLRTAAKGDEVITSGGIHGKVSAVDGEVLEVEVAKLRGGERVKLRVALARVDQLIKAGAAGAADKKSDGGGES